MSKKSSKRLLSEKKARYTEILAKLKDDNITVKEERELKKELAELISEIAQLHAKSLIEEAEPVLEKGVEEFLSLGKDILSGVLELVDEVFSPHSGNKSTEEKTNDVFQEKIDQFIESDFSDIEITYRTLKETKKMSSEEILEQVVRMTIIKFYAKNL